MGRNDTRAPICRIRRGGVAQPFLDSEASSTAARAPRHPMNDRHDLELVLDSGTPIVVIETADETRFLELLTDLAVAQRASSYRPLFRWSVTDGLQRLD